MEGTQKSLDWLYTKINQRVFRKFILKRNPCTQIYWKWAPSISISIRLISGEKNLEISRKAIHWWIQMRDDENWKPNERKTIWKISEESDMTIVDVYGEGEEIAKESKSKI
jgi:hypothetical protein